MRKIIVHEFISLDGVIQAPGGADEDTDGGFAHGGWTLPYWHDDIGAHFSQAFEAADALLLGRKTWHTHGAAFDPMTGDVFADAMNAMPKFVVSTTLKDAKLWRNSTIISKDVIEEVRKLKAKPGKNMLIDGSSVLCHALAENDLIDEYDLHVYPLSLGGGKRLFPEGKRINLKLLEAKALPTGVVFQRYEAIK
jgi:dihydrofolate reductase